MKNETSQKIAKSVLQVLVLLSLAVLITLGILQILGRDEIPGAFQSFLTVFFAAVAVAIFGQRTFSRVGFTLAKGGLTVGRPIGDHWISYHSITRVERISRKGSKQAEKVRLSFMQSGEEKAVELNPANPNLLVHDILARCPHLHKSKNSKMKRNQAFRAAKVSLHPRRKNPSVEY